MYTNWREEDDNRPSNSNEDAIYDILQEHTHSLIKEQIEMNRNHLNQYTHTNIDGWLIDIRNIDRVYAKNLYYYYMERQEYFNYTDEEMQATPFISCLMKKADIERGPSHE